MHFRPSNLASQQVWSLWAFYINSSKCSLTVVAAGKWVPKLHCLFNVTAGEVKAFWANCLFEEFILFKTALSNIVDDLIQHWFNYSLVPQIYSVYHLIHSWYICDILKVQPLHLQYQQGPWLAAYLCGGHNLPQSPDWNRINLSNKSRWHVPAVKAGLAWAGHTNRAEQVGHVIFF